MGERARLDVVLSVAGAGLLWGATLVSFSSKVGSQWLDPTLARSMRPLSSALYVALFLVALQLFRRESRVYTDARCSWAMVALLVLGSLAEAQAGPSSGTISLAALVAGMVLLQTARSYFDFAVFYHFVRLDSAIRLPCVALGSAVAMLALSAVSCLPSSLVPLGSTALAALAGVVLSLRLLAGRALVGRPSGVDLHAPHSLSLKRWAYLPYGFCTAAVPGASYFVLQGASPDPVLAALIAACMAFLLFLGVERDRGLLAASLCAPALAALFASSVMGASLPTLISCGYLFTYLGTCALFSYGVPSMSERWYADPMAVVVAGYAAGCALGIWMEGLPGQAVSGVLMAKALALPLFGMAVPLFALASDWRQGQAGRAGIGGCGAEPAAEGGAEAGRAWNEGGWRRLDGSAGGAQGGLPGGKRAGAPAGMGAGPLERGQREASSPSLSHVQSLCLAAERKYGLTQREAQVLGYVLQGFSEKYAADAMMVSKTTVHTHVRHIYAKMDVHSHDELSHRCRADLGEGE